jgi:hypothetical protein
MALIEPSALAPAEGAGAEGQARSEAFRRQESGLILLNLAILAGILKHERARPRPRPSGRGGLMGSPQ